MPRMMIEYSPDAETMRKLREMSDRKMRAVHEVVDEIVKTHFDSYESGSGSERRLFSRVSISLPAVVEYSQHKRECRIHPVQIVNMSLGGVKISVSPEFNMDSISEHSAMMLIFSTYDSGKPLAFRCIPCRIENSDDTTNIGLKFVDGSFEDYRMLAERMQ